MFLQGGWLGVGHFMQYHKNQTSHITRKPVFGVFDQVNLKQGCSATEAR